MNIPSGLYIKNAWTGAGIASFVHVASKLDKSINVLFDCGSIEPSCLKANNIFITHGHTDHCGAMIQHARSRGLSHNYANYYVPPSCLDSVMAAKAAFEQLDGKEISMNIFIFQPNIDSIQLSPSLRIVAFDTIHRVPSQGYAIYYQPKPKIMNKYKHLSSKEINALRKEHIQYTEICPEVLQFVYTGDTTFEGLLQPHVQFIFKSPILVLECTYLDVDDSKSYQKSIEYGHIHIDDIIKYKHHFIDVQYVVLVHFSMKYTPFYQAIDKINGCLPVELLEKCYGCMKALGSREYITKIMNNPNNSNNNGYNGYNNSVGYGWGSHKRTIQRGVDKQKQPRSVSSNSCSVSNSRNNNNNNNNNSDNNNYNNSNNSIETVFTNNLSNLNVHR